MKEVIKKKVDLIKESKTAQQNRAINIVIAYNNTIIYSVNERNSLSTKS